MARIIIIALLIAGAFIFVNYNTNNLPDTVTPEDLLVTDSTYLNNKMLDSVLSELTNLVEEKNPGTERLVLLLRYLKAYSHFGTDLTDVHYDQINSILTSLSESDLLQDQVIQSIYANNVHRWTSIEAGENWLTHFKTLAKLTSEQLAIEDAENRTLWEILYSQGVMLRWVKTSATDEQKEGFVEYLSTYKDQLISEYDANQPAWVNKHLLWLTAKVHHFLDDKQSKALDEQVLKLLEGSTQLDESTLKTLATEGYFIPSFNTQENCLKEPWQKYCLSYSMDEALPINHTCSDSLFIRATSMSDEELADSCTRLIAQESHFHDLFQTDLKPVGDDLNESLRVVIFDDWHHYHRYAPILFDINTDNGGMYIEGAPDKPGNQATFFAFEAFWLRPEFKVWNLNHEYVHYLTGRFTTYGPYGHYPSHMVWWSEGIAEYISKGDTSIEANKLLVKTEEAEIPTLERILAAKYSDGLDFTYRWSYWTVRFLAETSPQSLITLKQALASNDFEAYQSGLNQVSTAQQDAFHQWMVDKKSNLQSIAKTPIRLPRKINRYSYPAFLKPDWVKQEGWNQHF